MNPHSFKQFSRLVARVMETLPAELAEYLDDNPVAVDVYRAPTPKLLRKIGFDHDEIDEASADLLGYYMPADEVSHPLARILVFHATHLEQFPDPRDFRIEV